MSDSHYFATRITELLKQDEGFRDALVDNPKKILEAEFGVIIPDNMTITVMERRPNERIIVLPPAECSSDPSVDERDATVW